MNAYYFREDKTAVLDVIKAQLPFSGRQILTAKFVKLNSVPCSFLSFEFSATTSEQFK